MRYDQKRYNIAPWRGRFGDAQHSVRLSKTRDKILKAIEDKRHQQARIEQQIRQLEVLAETGRGTLMDGVLVRQIDSSVRVTLSLVSRTVRRHGYIYKTTAPGELWGLQLEGDGTDSVVGKFRGWGHTKKQAYEDLRAWVTTGAIRPERYK